MTSLINLAVAITNWTLVALFIAVMAALLLIGGFLATNFGSRESNEMKRRKRS